MKLKKKSIVNLHTDSQYTINGIEKWWAKKWKANDWMRTKSEKATNHDLWEKLLILVEKHEVRFHWVKWHNWHEENERCDELAVIAAQGDNLKIDEVFENYELLELQVLQSIALYNQLRPHMSIGLLTPNNANKQRTVKLKTWKQKTYTKLMI